MSFEHFNLPFFFLIEYVPEVFIIRIIIGIIALIYLIKGAKTAYVLEGVYCLTWAVRTHPADMIVLIAVIVGLMISKSLRQYFGWSAITTPNEEKLDLSQINVKHIGYKQIIVTSILALVISIVAIPIVKNLNQVFYTDYSRKDHKHILSYINETYGSQALEIVLPDGFCDFPNAR